MPRIRLTFMPELITWFLSGQHQTDRTGKTMDNTIEIKKIGRRGLLAIKVNDKTVGYVRRTEVEVPARNVYYPCTTTRVEWHAQNEVVGFISSHTTRKAAIESVIQNINVA